MAEEENWDNFPVYQAPKRRGGSPTELRARKEGPKPEPNFMDPQQSLAGVIGFGEGGTAGLYKYPVAAGRSLFGGDSYREELDRIHATSARLQKEYPKDFFGGEMLGSGALGVATGGTGLVPNLVRGGVQGAISGYTARPGELLDKQALIDTGVGLGTGLVGAGVSHAIPAGADKAKDFVVKEFQQVTNKLPKNIGEELAQSMHLPLAERNAIVKKYGYKNVTDYNKRGKSTDANPDAVPPTRAEVEKIVKENSSGPLSQSKDVASHLYTTSKGMIVPLGVGYLGSVGGGTMAQMAGLDPLAGQIIGGLVGGGMTFNQARQDVTKKGLKELASMVGQASLNNPKVAPNTAKIIRGLVSGVAAPGVRQMKDTPEDLSSFPEVKDADPDDWSSFPEYKK